MNYERFARFSPFKKKKESFSEKSDNIVTFPMSELRDEMEKLSTIYARLGRQAQADKQDQLVGESLLLLGRLDNITVATEKKTKKFSDKSVKVEFFTDGTSPLQLSILNESESKSILLRLDGAAYKYEGIFLYALSPEQLWNNTTLPEVKAFNARLEEIMKTAQTVRASQL